MKKLIPMVLALTALMSFAGEEYPELPRKITDETPAQKAERMAWWQHDRFGMFIHFGLYAMPARHEWVRNKEWITNEEYERYFRKFDPDLFDAKDLARRAKAAGMKYAVLTTKHHEGFCLWDSKFTDYKITNTPFGRDLVKELTDACHAEGMKVGFYYSLLDWHHPDFTIDPIHPRRPKGEVCWGGTGTNEKGYAELNATRNMRRYAQYMKDQVTELLTNYGKIDLLWYDFSYPDRGKCWEQWDSIALLELTRRLQPGIIVNDRLDLSDTDGGWDFMTVEQKKAAEWPMRNGRRAVWETCQTFSGSWGYARDEKTWKSREDLLGLLVETVSKGGNLILNVGPTGRGDFDYRAKDRLEAMGEWMRVNSRAVYGCTKAPSDYPAPKGTLLTWNEPARRLYMTFESYPTNGLVSCDFASKVSYAQFLHDASEIEVTEKGLGIPADKPPVALPVVELVMKPE